MKTMKKMLAMLLALAITVAFAPVTSAETVRTTQRLDFENSTLVTHKDYPKDDKDDSRRVSQNKWTPSSSFDPSTVITPGYTINAASGSLATYPATYPDNWQYNRFVHVDTAYNMQGFLVVNTGDSRIFPTDWNGNWMWNSTHCRQMSVSVDIAPDQAGWFIPKIKGVRVKNASDFAVLVDEKFVGNYYFYDSTATGSGVGGYHSGPEKSLNAVYLEAGSHNIFLRAIDLHGNTSPLAYLQYIDLVPIEEISGFELKSSFDDNMTMKIGDTQDFEFSIENSAGEKRYLGFERKGTETKTQASTHNNISYQITEGADVINITGGELVATYDEGLKGSITALKSGTAKIEIKGTIDGEVKAPITRTITVGEDNPNDVTTNPNVSVYIVAENAESSLISVTEGGVTAGNVGGEVARGTTISATANSNEDYEFLYWMDNAQRYIQDDATYTFTAGTNTAVWAVYADKTDNLKLVDYFTDYGTRVYSTEAENEASVTVPALEMTGYTGGAWKKSIDNAEYVTFTPDLANATKATVSVTLDGEAYKTGSYGDPVTVGKTLSNFVSWMKNGKLVSYNDNYTFFAWNGTEALVQSETGEKSSFPGVVLFKDESKYMLELVNCEGVEIIEKGILFDGTIDSCLKKFVSRTELSQFTIVEDSLTDAKAYVIYRDGADLRVAYSN